MPNTWNWDRVGSSGLYITKSNWVATYFQGVDKEEECCANQSSYSQLCSKIILLLAYILFYRLPFWLVRLRVFFWQLPRFGSLAKASCYRPQSQVVARTYQSYLCILSTPPLLNKTHKFDYFNDCSIYFTNNFNTKGIT